MPFLGPKWLVRPKQFFLGTNHYSCFLLPVGPFHCAKFAKIFYSGSKFLRMRLFWAQNAPPPLPPPKFSSFSFFWKWLVSFSSTYLLISPFHYAKFLVQKYFQRIQSYEDVQVLGPKWPNCPNENFFQKTFLWILFLSFMSIYTTKIKVRY